MKRINNLPVLTCIAFFLWVIFFILGLWLGRNGHFIMWANNLPLEILTTPYEGRFERMADIALENKQVLLGVLIYINNLTYIFINILIGLLTLGVGVLFNLGASGLKYGLIISSTTVLKSDVVIFEMLEYISVIIGNALSAYFIISTFRNTKIEIKKVCFTLALIMLLLLIGAILEISIITNMIS
jgi:hypothetical protein